MEIIFHIENGIKCKDCGRIIKYTDVEFLEYIQKFQEFQQKVVTVQKQLQGQSDGADKVQIDDATIKSLKNGAPELVCPSCGKKEFIEMIKIVQDPQTKKDSLIVDGHVITKDDFNRLRQIVLFQNFPDYRDDSWVDPDLKRDYEAKLQLEQKQNDVHATIEKKVVCLSITTSYSFSEIYDMSIRKFTMALTAVDDLINYKIMKTATMSGFVSLPKGQKIDHWIYKPNKDMYGDAYKSMDDAQSEIKNL